jgi:hypothetical protein
MPIEKPIIEFKDGKKLTKFPDGTIREQTPEDAERYRQFLVKEKERIERHLTLLDDDVKKMVLSKKAV